MGKLTDYVMNYNTVLFLPRTNEYGELYTFVLDKTSSFDVQLGPTDLIDFNLKYYGSSLKGAREGAIMILGGGKMSPVMINEKLDLYWFPSKSPAKEDCIWFALHHIKETIKLPNIRTKVIMSDGNIIIVEMSKESFDKKIQKAYNLKGKIEARTKIIPMHVSEVKGAYVISKAEKGLNFEIISTLAQYKYRNNN